MQRRTCGPAIVLSALAALASCRRPPATAASRNDGSDAGPGHALVAMPGPAPQRPPAPLGPASPPTIPDDEPPPPANAPFSGDAPPLRRCFDGSAGLAVDRPIGELLDRAEDRFDKGDLRGALDCAEEAARRDGTNVEAQHDRAAVLAALGRLEDARRAYTLALALGPDDPDVLAGASDLYINRLGPDHDDTEIGLALARRGQEAARRADHVDRDLLGRLSLLAGQALDDLGRSDQALPEIEAALADRPADEDTLYEKGVALFSLCRFAPAKAAIEAVIAADPDDAFAHEHLGLVLEQLEDPAGAQAELARATELSPKDFPPVPQVTPTEFDAMVRRAVDGLPTSLKAGLASVRLEIADLPALSDLLAADPPFAPTILGLFRGAALTEPVTPGDPAANRAIVLYRKNLLRAVSSVEELQEQIGVTLLHELGHLRGEDEDDLRARGLE